MNYKLITSILFFLSFLISAIAQCDTCETNKDDLTYCYSNENFSNYCATFTDGQATFLLSKDKKSKSIPLTVESTLKERIAAAQNKKLKISAVDMLFIQEALSVWKLERWNIGQVYTETGLGIKTYTKGTGALPKKGEKVKVHYSGFLEDGTKFDSSVDRNEPFIFQLGKGRVIKAWDEAFQKLPIGSKALIKVPAELGYGPRGAGGVIPPNATLFFEVEVLGVE